MNRTHETSTGEPRPTNRTIPLLVAATLFASTACATRQAPPPPPAERASSPTAEASVPTPEPFDAASLRAEVDAAVSTYRDGVDLLVSGDELSAEDLIADASIRLIDAAERCGSDARCDPAPIVAAFDVLLSEQGLALKQQAYRIETLEASAAEAEPLDRELGFTGYGLEPVPENYVLTGPDGGAEPMGSAPAELDVAADGTHEGGEVVVSGGGVEAVMPEVDRAASLLRGTDFRSIIEMNGPVKVAIEDWLTWMRPMLLDSWENYQLLRTKVAPVYEEAGLPEALLFAMIATETGGKTHATSRAGASGLLQFMRYTGRRYGLVMDDGFDLRFDPESATRANVAYLNEQFAVLNDELPKVLAAYNGGENRLRGLHRRYPKTDLWDSRVFYALPRETREYVPRILAAAWLFLHPEEYGIEFPQYAQGTTHLVLEDAISITELAVCLGQTGTRNGWFRALRNLNPRLKPGEPVDAGERIEVPVGLVDAYGAHCVDHARLALARDLHDVELPKPPPHVVHVVRRGETLGKIANRYRCASITNIARANNIRAPRYVIRAGQRLKIPTCG